MPFGFARASEDAYRLSRLEARQPAPHIAAPVRQTAHAENALARFAFEDPLDAPADRIHAHFPDYGCQLRGS